ncbi:MAG: fused MFS/spermidine synthase [Prosthecobacter sp.]|uniref:fused MFS/spermidine synthase n=1 Tax=Prosthecobacter sp. TaxID=1965333 RepID=UPI00261D3ECD|nr:fused MFS/spermidine synthase [Prosthecobacter sp.]MCF7789488.1 fused MFS/spermidine synthase [Prosthecobacter sp.]
MTLTPALRLPFLACLLALSGACALVYQMAWLREFRLVFGGATPATAAVLAIFMGAMGAGSALFGRKAEASANPLRLYAWIELGVGIAALLTPLLLSMVRSLYLSTGGIAALGQVPATLLQLLLATVVLAPPCLLMGGSLPAAFKWVETDQDAQRGSLGVLYGVNTLGALAGVLVSTFWLLELWGIRTTVMAAAGVNLLIGGIAWYVAREVNLADRSDPSKTVKPTTPGAEAVAASPLTARFLYLAAGITGFTFFLSELVWFRILSPLLGSSVYGFGLILALALAGIGLGGLLYRMLWAARAGAVTLVALARVAAWQALFLALPFALGDRIAVFAIDVNQLRSLGLPGQIAGWTLIASLLVLGPSILAGVQFPLLVGLLGSGSCNAGRHVGYAYAANTLGAIAGSLAGGFVLLPWLTALGAWHWVFLLTLLLSLGAALLGARSASRWSWPVIAVLWFSAGWLMFVPTGPTAAWRHKPIGYGRVESLPNSINGLRGWLHASRWKIAHEFEGREASVAAVSSDDGYCLYVNGKSDGSAFGDADTQVMQGLVPALLHPAPHTAFIVGLGTGTTAGWVADVPEMKQVDVVELEPAMASLARNHFAPVNRDVLNKANVHLIPGDAREALLAAGSHYDLIISEPSNPYRAGVSTLFTQEFYAAAKARLNEHGLFAQWVQGYEVDAHAIRQVYATLTSVFPHVETWISGPNDLLFIGHLTPPEYTMEQLRTRIAQPLMTEALKRVWLTNSVEGVLAHHLASPEFARSLLQHTPANINTDDRNLLEYGFARALSKDNTFETTQVLSMAIAQEMDVPSHLAAKIDHTRLTYERLRMLAADGATSTIPSELNGDDQRRADAAAAFAKGNFDEVLTTWVGTPTSPFEQLMLLESTAQAGTAEQLIPFIAAVRQDWPADAHFAAALSAFRNESYDDAASQLLEGFKALRPQVWVRLSSVQTALSLVPPLAANNRDLVPQFMAVLQQPFPGGLAEPSRMNTLVEIIPLLSPAQQIEVLSLFEPNPPWQRQFLEFRLKTYRAAAHALTPQAERDLQEFLRHADRRLDEAR